MTAHIANRTSAGATALRSDLSVIPLMTKVPEPLSARDCSLTSNLQDNGRKSATRGCDAPGAWSHCRLCPGSRSTRKLTHYPRKLALTHRQLFACSTPRNRCPFFQSLPHLFHTATPRNSALDTTSGLHCDCQP